jgi:hypothetical protein
MDIPMFRLGVAVATPVQSNFFLKNKLINIKATSFCRVAIETNGLLERKKNSTRFVFPHHRTPHLPTSPLGLPLFLDPLITMVLPLPILARNK